MKNSQTAVWTVLTLFIAVLLAVGAYFLAIEPQLSATQDAHAAKQAATDFNDQLDLQILAAKAKEKKVPQWLGEMNAIAIDLPPLPNQPELHRMIVGALEQRGLPVVSIEYGSTQLIAPGTPQATTTAPATGETGVTDAASATPTPTPTPTPAPTPAAAKPAPTAGSTSEASGKVDGLVGIPVTVTTEGDPTAIMQFLAEMQSQNSRFLTVTNLDITRAEVSDAKKGRRALTTSDWVASVTYLAYSLIDPSKSFPVEVPGKNAPYTGGGVVNPFVPLDGSGL